MSCQRFTLGNLDEALSFRPFAPDADLEAFQIIMRALQAHRGLKFLLSSARTCSRSLRILLAR